MVSDDQPDSLTESKPPDLEALRVRVAQLENERDRLAAVMQLQFPTEPPLTGETAIAEAWRLLQGFARLKANGLKLLNTLGGVATCDGPKCKRAIWWVTTKNGKPMPVTSDLQPHWIDCPDRERFRRKPAKAAP